MLYEKFLRDKKGIQEIVRKIGALKIKAEINIMEVCGTHTYTFFRFGLKKIVPSNINLISGPGCPVCITEDIFIDKAIALSKGKTNIIATFGDLIRVKGSRSSLEQAREKGANILVVYSPAEAIELALSNTKKRIIFLGVGFETTSPLIASLIKEAKEKKIKNLFLLSNHRLIPPAMQALCQDKEMKVDGFMCPGHVSAIIGEKPYKAIVNNFGKGCVICGFEPLDMLLTIYMLLLQIKADKPRVENEYNRVVRPQGNILARKLIEEVFMVEDASWRGFGVIKKSGLTLRDKYKDFDAQKLLKKDFSLKEKKNNNCLCAEVIKGKIRPIKCPEFRRNCSPDNPLGPCMVSFEGSCRIYYEYAG